MSHYSGTLTKTDDNQTHGQRSQCWTLPARLLLDLDLSVLGILSFRPFGLDIIS